jgi:hypothetical protein
VKAAVAAARAVLIAHEAAAEVPMIILLVKRHRAQQCEQE